MDGKTVDRSEAARAAADAVREDQVIDLVRGALSIPSLSGEEEAVARYFVDRMGELDIAAELQPVPHDPMMPGPSFNALGTHSGSGGGTALLFNGHIDHNPVSDGWTKDPFGAEIEDGYLYGFVHMKAADACYIAALDAVRRAGVPLRGDVHIALVCGELRGGAGTKHALAQGLMADYFVLGEPTELELATKHTASIVADIHVLGRTKHFATQEVSGKRGINAVEKIAKVIPLLGTSHQPLPPRDKGGWLSFSPKPGFEGLPQLNLGGLQGGISRQFNRTRPALMPDRAALTVDFRIVPGMSKQTIEEDLRRLLDGLAEEDPDFAYEIEFQGETFPHPFNSPDDSPVVETVGRNHHVITGTPASWSAVLKFAASDASWMARAGIPGLVYGPTGKYLSRPDECGLVEDFVTVTKVYAASIAEICG
jgi:acetylornithine deacetylase